MAVNYLEVSRKFPEFSKGDIEVFIEVFNTYDVDHKGSINAKELATVLKTIGQGCSPQDIKQVYSILEKDESHSIEFEEFLQLMRYFYPWKVLEFKHNFLEPAIKFPEFNKTELYVFLDMFREFDEDDSGTISIYELDKLFKSMGQGCSQEKLEKIMKEYDAHQTGELDWPEFLGIMRSFYPEKLAQHKKKFYEPAKDFPEFTISDIDSFILSFKEFDLDGNGSIDAQELDLAFKAMGQGCSADALKKIIEEFDEDKNGTIGWHGFLKIMRKFYPERKKDYELKYYEPAKKFPQFSKNDIDVFVHAFRQHDVDGCGSINNHELGLAFKEMGQGCTPEKLQQIINEVDENGNGVIEWPEFLQIMANIYSGKYSGSRATKEIKTDSVSINSNSTSTPASNPTSTPASNPTSTPASNPTSTPASNPTPTSNANTPSTPKSKSETSMFTKTTAPSNTSTKSVGVGIGQRGPSTPKCVACGKTAYPTESISAANQTWHKLCFKCQDSSCSISLTLKTFHVSGEKVFCPIHVPKHKANVGTQSIAISAAVSAPKLKGVSGIKKDVRMTFGPGAIKAVNPEEQPQE